MCWDGVHRRRARPSAGVLGALRSGGGGALNLGPWDPTGLWVEFRESLNMAGGKLHDCYHYQS